MNTAAHVSCSVVIATLDRVESLRVVLDCLQAQTRPPLEILIAVAGDPSALTAHLATRPPGIPTRLVESAVKSSALQRNQAAELASADVIVFLDDDIEFAGDLFARVLAHFDRMSDGELGALSPRIANTGRDAPGRLTLWYYRLQAGYPDPDYGGRLFGPGINCFPVFSSQGPELVRSDWLPSTCLFMRCPLFRRTLFPSFVGYSFAEDVHLTARARREAPIYFLREPSILHYSLPSEFKSDRAALVVGKLHNMSVVAREAMGLSGWALWWRWQLHRLFLSTILLARRPKHWAVDFRGVWQARP